MKILITTDWYLPAVNGVVTSVVNLARHLEEMGDEVRILTLSMTGEAYTCGNVCYLPSKSAARVYPGARFCLAPSRALVKRLIAWQPDLVHCQCEFSTFPFALRIAHAVPCPMVYTCHTLYEDYTRYLTRNSKIGRRGAELIIRFAAHKADAVIAPSGKMVRYLNAFHVKTPVFCIPTGIETAHFAAPLPEEKRNALRAHLGIGKEEMALVLAGRLAPEKNPEEVFTFLAASKQPGVHLVVAGDGPLWERLQAKAGSPGLSGHITFTGMLSQEQMADLYRACDLYVCASRSETQGLTYMEAMASGLPLLCRYDACLDGVLLPGKTGFFWENREEFAASLRRLCEDTRLRKSLGQNARDLALRSYCADRFAGRARDLYRHVIQDFVREKESGVHGSVKKESFCP